MQAFPIVKLCGSVSPTMSYNFVVDVFGWIGFGSGQYLQMACVFFYFSSGPIISCEKEMANVYLHLTYPQTECRREYKKKKKTTQNEISHI